MRADFLIALNGLIDSFADDEDFGISDEEIVATLMAKVRAIHAAVREREGEEVVS